MDLMTDEEAGCLAQIIGFFVVMVAVAVFVAVVVGTAKFVWSVL